MSASVLTALTLCAVLLVAITLRVVLLAVARRRRGGGARTAAFAEGEVYPAPRVLRGVLSAEECARLIALAEGSGMQQSLVVHPGGDTANGEVRRSEQAWLQPGADPGLGRLSAVAAALSGKPAENQEEVQIAKYVPGGFYRQHYDACEKDCGDFTARGGQRFATLLVYLSDGFAGGETRFSRLDMTTLPRRGDALFFHNTDGAGRLHRDSQHGGEPVLAGTKWIANIWVREGRWSRTEGEGGAGGASA